MNIIEARDIFFSYKSQTEQKQVLSGFSVSVKEGDFVCIIGPNGCGKSTFAKLLNVLEKPGKGSLKVDNLDCSDDRNTRKIRTTLGLVFQNPDNQIIGDSVEEDVAFGPENLGLETREIERRVSESLATLGLTELKNINPSKLSGGQKQRVAIAGILAIGCRCLVLDEATSMLDPKARKEVLDALHKLNRDSGTTVVLITHHMEECLNADNIIVMDGGKIVMTGSPREVFSNSEKLKELGLNVPPVTELGFELGLKEAVLTEEELIEALKAKKGALC